MWRPSKLYPRPLILLLKKKKFELWDRLDAFKRSISQRKAQGATPYSFYDGLPFATGLPHYGHLVTSSIKDTVARYWTMRGHYVERRFGWDTHGLPIEMETEKALNLSGPIRFALLVWIL